MSNPGAGGSPTISESNDRSSASGAGSSAGSHPSITVTKIEKVAGTCSNSSGAKLPASKRHEERENQQRKGVGFLCPLCAQAIAGSVLSWWLMAGTTPRLSEPNPHGRSQRTF
jgi:hypothetical protein